MDYITDDETLQRDAYQSFRKRHVFSRTSSEAQRVRRPLSEIASNEVGLRGGFSSGLARVQGTELQEVGRSGRKKISRPYLPAFSFESEREPSRNAVSINREHTPTCKQWVMMCLPRRKWERGLSTLHQLEFSERPATNAEYFARLRREYEARSIKLYPRLGKLSWLLAPRKRKLTEIQFVKFETRFPMSATVIEVTENPSVPSEDEQGWTCTLRRDTSQAPLDAKSMVDALYGDELEGASIYDWTPRKLQDELPAEGNLYGWGLRFFEVEVSRARSKWVLTLLAVLCACGIRIAVMLKTEPALGISVGNLFLVIVQILYMLAN